MIARLWHGYTTPESADSYEQLLKTKILPGIHRAQGYQGCYLLRKNAGNEVDFLTVTLWESLEVIRGFSGQDYELAVVPPEARKLLARFDARSVHYEGTWCP